MGMATAQMAPDLEHLDARGVLEYAVERFHPRLVVACSFQKEASVVLDLILRAAPGSSRSTRTSCSRRPTRPGRPSSSATGSRSRSSRARASAARPPSTATACGSATPTPAATCARCSRSTGRSPTSTPGSPACAETSRPRAPARPSWPGTPSTSAGSSTRSRTGPTATSGATSRSTTCPTTRCTTRATPRSAARTAPSPVRGARAAGRARARPSAACTPRFLRPGDHARVEQLPDLARAEPEHAREDLLRVLAEQRRAPRRHPAGRGQLQRRGRDEVLADAGLVERGEHRVLLRGARVLADELAERLVRAPGDAGALERLAHRVQRAGLEPGPQHGRDDVASAEAPVLGGEVVARDALQRAECLGGAGDLLQRGPLAAGERHDHHAASVAGAEVGPEGAVEVVAVAPCGV